MKPKALKAKALLKEIWFAQIDGWHVIPLGITIALGMLVIALSVARLVEVIWPTPSLK